MDSSLFVHGDVRRVSYLGYLIKGVNGRNKMARKRHVWRPQTATKTLLGALAFVVAPMVLAGALPTDSTEILPGTVTAGTGGDTIELLISWAVRLLAYGVMIIAAIGAAWFIFQAFGEAATTKNGWGKFAGVAVGSLIMVGLVVTIGLIAVGWAAGLAGGIS